MNREGETAPGISASIKNWITWFGGSIAAFTAALYTAGYLAVRAHVNMLGLDVVLEVGGNEFLQEGAKFAFMVGASLTLAALSVGVALAILAAPVLYARRLLTRRMTATTLTRIAHYWRRAFRPLLFAFVLIAFLWTVWSDIDVLRSPLCVTNVLYREPDLSQCGASLEDGARTFVTKLKEASPLALQSAYVAMMTTVVLHAAFLTGVAAWLAASWPLRRWLLAPFVIAVALMLSLLPMDYGVMVRPVRYPRVELTLTERASSEIGAPLYLLQASDKTFTVWDASQRSVVWLPASVILRADVRAIENPLTAPAAKGGGR